MKHPSAGNTQQGISLNGSVAIGNAVFGNQRDGILARGGSVVVQNTSNSGDGIQTQDAATLQRNMLHSNTGYGIRITVTGPANGATYEGNTA